MKHNTKSTTPNNQKNNQETNNKHNSRRASSEWTLEDELENKIQEMESADYEFPKRFSKGDYIFTLIIIFISLICVICGAFVV